MMKQLEDMSKEEIERETLTTAELCNLLGVTDRTVRRWVHDGTITAYQIGNARKSYFLRSEIAEALKPKNKD